MIKNILCSSVNYIFSEKKKKTSRALECRMNSTSESTYSKIKSLFNRSGSGTSLIQSSHSSKKSWEVENE